METNMDQHNPVTPPTNSTEAPRVDEGCRIPDMQLEIPDSLRTGERPPKQEKKGEPQRVEIVLRVEAAEVKTEDTVKEEGRGQTTDDGKDDPIPARMLNEFVYCKRLFYYEFVEGVFVESADTLRGGAIHERVDSGSGAMPSPKGKSEIRNPKSENE